MCRLIACIEIQKWLQRLIIHCAQFISAVELIHTKREIIHLLYFNKPFFASAFLNKKYQILSS